MKKLVVSAIILAAITLAGAFPAQAHTTFSFGLNIGPPYYGYYAPYPYYYPYPRYYSYPPPYYYPRPYYRYHYRRYYRPYYRPYIGPYGYYHYSR